VREVARRLGICAAALVVCTAAVLPLYSLWFDLALLPAQVKADGSGPVVFGHGAPADLLLAYLGASLVPAVALAMPVISYQVWALASRPPRGARPPNAWRVAAAGTLLFTAGVAFAYFALLPAHLFLV
jgi:sec-independent protein translocase protein TatC